MKRVTASCCSMLCALAVTASIASVPFANAESLLPMPQLVQDGQMLLVGFEADPQAVRDLLPKGLEPLPNHMVLMNMYTVPDGARTSGLGAYTLTYLTILVRGHDGYIAGSPDPLPGRYLAYYWNSSESMRKVTRANGFPDQPGGMTAIEQADGKARFTLTVDGRPFIQATADVSGEPSPPAGGQTNYFSKTDKGVMQYPIPWVCRGLKTENPAVTFSMSPQDPVAKLKPKKVVFAMRMNCDIVYPQSVALSK